jgi:AraC-like DNA-binding protein
MFSISAVGTRGHRDGKAAHHHPEGQLVVVRDGLLIVSTAGTTLMLPPGHIGWIPPNQVHAGAAFGITTGWNAYLHPRFCSTLAKQPAVLKLTMLTEALFARICEWTPSENSSKAIYTRLLDVLLDELRSTKQERLALPVPADDRLKVLVAQIAADPSDKRSLKEYARLAGLSVRSLSRLFRSETNMSLVEWRTMARMKGAVEQIVRGQSVTETAMVHGYDSVSTFTAQFRKTFGTTPSEYQRSHEP